METIKLTLFLALTLLHLSTNAKNTSRIAFSAYQSNYQDLSLSSDGSKQELPPSLDVELSFRLYSIFNFSFVASKFMHDEESSIGSLSAERQAFGLGMKIDFPGIFFVGASRTFASRNGKNWPVNSFCYGNIQQVSTKNATGEKDQSMVATYGLGFDIFLFNKLAFISALLGGYQLENNTYLQTGFGLGVAF
ncbi:MAG: hypothetical protein KDD58_05045 [Bdellovibrionales bacterium]|nr:hypothetical protein [Bdellovibrionales bacterium]